MYCNFFKRPIDLLAVLIVSVILLPLLVAVAIAILILDPGPVIFRQARVGRDGRPFVFFKFRSLPTSTGNVPSDALDTSDVGVIGRFIRRTNIDELPQLFNILKGDMAIVGPRPPLSTQTELVTLRRTGGALDCRPGLTGWAQVNAYDGMSIGAKAALDCEYARNISFVRDCQIVLRTLKYLRSPPPKY